MTNPYKKSLEAGYSADQIIDFLSKHPNYSEKIKKSKEAGYTNEQIGEFLSQTSKPFENIAPKKAGGSEASKFFLGEKERTAPEKINRLIQQGLVGLGQSAALPYEIATLPLSTTSFGVNEIQEQMSQDLDNLLEKKEYGLFTSEDQKQYDFIIDHLKNPEKIEKLTSPIDVGIKGLTEKSLGLDLKPEGALEYAANWTSFLKDPRKIVELAKTGLNTKDIIKSLIPGEKTLRGLMAGSALQLAEDGKLGPLGTITAAVFSDIAAHAPKQIYKIAREPQKYAAKAVNLFTGGNSKKAWMKQIIEDARSIGLQLDVGSLTGSPLIKMLQARASQSSLSGKALDNFRQTISNHILEEYKNTMDQVGSMRFENNYQAAEAIKQALKVEDLDLGVFGKQPEKAKGTTEQLGQRVSRSIPPEIEELNRNLLDRISPEVEATGQAGENLKTAANDIKTPIKEEFNERFTNINQRIGQIEIEPHAQLVGDLENFVRQHEGSLLLGESTAEHRVLRAAERLIEQLSVEGGLVGRSINELIKTKQTIGDIAKWEFGGSNYESLYKHLNGILDEAIERSIGQFDPNLLQEYQTLKADYSQYKDIFENKNVMPLFEPKNENFNSIWNSFVSNPDKLISLEDAIGFSPRGQQLVNQVKRDYAQKILNNPNVSDRSLRDLAHTLGPQYAGLINEFRNQLENLRNLPGSRALPSRDVGIRPQAIPTRPQKPVSKKAEIHPQSIRKKAFESLKNKSSDQIMKMMDSVESIKKLKSILELTPEGKELFKELSRYKIAQMIDNKLQDNITKQIKLGKFANLISTAEEKAIIKELVGKENFDKLLKLQTNAGRLAESANRFFNASQSGVTVLDTGIVTGAFLGVLSGNPFAVLSSIGSIVGLRTLANLFTDTKFLRYLEEAILTKDPIKFSKLFKKLDPSVKKASLEASKKGIEEDAI